MYIGGFDFKIRFYHACFKLLALGSPCKGRLGSPCKGRNVGYKFCNFEIKVHLASETSARKLDHKKKLRKFNKTLYLAIVIE